MTSPPNVPNQPRRENRLSRSTSPYLLQHRFNPVDWHPWGTEAFEEARRRDVPIFLSIGYSTCYWCHVMERESFENESIAEMLNERFVCIKVDREQRPDVDDIYMAAVQAFRGQGGWPMSVFLEPRTLKPYWAGTYFPAEPKFPNIPTFPQVLQGVSSAWNDQRDEVLAQAEKLAEAVRERLAEQGSPVRLGVSQVTEAVASLLKIHDARFGGFGSAPKFPQPVYIELLLDVRRNATDETRAAIDAVLRTSLDRMALGGIFDQVGGGFHRYSVDAEWIVPHFEKMLYDNAQLASVYAQAAHAFNEPLYRRTARRTIEYVLAEMTLPRDADARESGGEEPSAAFFSAQDAEVNHREGQNYLWTSEQFHAALNAEDAAFAARVYAVDAGPNFRDPHHPHDPPSNVLRWADSPSVLAATMNLSEHQLLSRIEKINEQLYAARAKRDQPLTDDKIITSWNGLMIGAMARAGSLLDRPDFTAAAERVAEFILRRMRSPDGSLIRTFRAGSVAGAAAPDTTGGFLEDYACMTHACIELHRAGGDSAGRWLDEAVKLAAEADGRFGDPATGAFFDTLADQQDLFVRARSTYDGAIPSGTSVLINALIDLFEITGSRAHFDRALRALRSLSSFLAESPVGAAGSSRALLRVLVLEPAAVQAAFAADPIPGTRPSDDFSPVEVLAAVERVVLAPDNPIPVTLRFRIADGFHINAADPGDSPDAADLIPLRVHIVNGTGVEVFADYPEGMPFGADGRLRVLAGEFELTIALERKGEWTGTPLIGVTYQACTEDACLAPRTVELDVALDPRD
jgi:uncharacterized protein YyaL (SSP411 family)